jgi:hypothetical protein
MKTMPHAHSSLSDSFESAESQRKAEKAESRLVTGIPRQTNSRHTPCASSAEVMPRRAAHFAGMAAVSPFQQKNTCLPLRFLCGSACSNDRREWA